MPKPVVLVDGSSYFFRAFHALPPLTNSKGQPTGAIYGVANMIKRLIKDYQPEYMAVIFDAKGKTFRHEWYSDYKSHRPPMPTELSTQFEPLIDLLKAMGLPIICVSGVEADDVIGTLARLATARAIDVVISTGDKDMAQLVNHHITLVNTMSNQRLTAEGVFEKFGVHPWQMIDYLSLIGDTSDNIPGVPKCGPKTAVKWLETYQTLENLIADAASIGGKIGENLRASLEQLPLAKKLVTIKTDVDLPLALDDLKRKAEDTAQLTTLTKNLEFKSWLNELLNKNNPATSSSTNSAPLPPALYEIIRTPEALQAWVEVIKQAGEVSIDTETTHIDAMQAELVGIALALPHRTPAYIPLTHQEASLQLGRQAVLSTLKPLLIDEQIRKIGQNLKYDYHVFKSYDITLKGIAYDTMLESYVLNSTARHDMDTLALTYLGHKTIRFEDVAGKGSKQLRFDEVAIDKAAAYAAEDASITLQLHHTLYPKLDKQLASVFHTIEMPLLPVIAEMERHGVLIDTHVLNEQGIALKARMNALEQEAITLAEHSFNLNSPKQLQTILYEQQQLPILAKTPKGQPSTAESVLQELAYDYPLPAVILQYRRLAKLVSTYIEALPKRIHPRTGRVHTSYNQAITATGRLSSSEPNLQNIPIRHEEGRLIRQAFIAPSGYSLIAADYSQIELRIMAHLSQDEGLQHAFSHGLDIHTATASELFNTPLAEITAEQRRRAKAVNFGLIYGMSAFGLAKQIGVSREEAQTYMNRYFERYPGVAVYMEKTRQQAHQQGYVETIFNRRLHLPDIHANNKPRQKAAERTAINAPMQGSAADIIKKAMLAIDHWQQTHRPPARMIMQVHDELVFEVQNEAIDSCKKVIQSLMEDTVQLSVPLVVSIGVGSNWDEAH